MALASLQPNMALKYFSSKLYRIRTRSLDSLGQILRLFTTLSQHFGMTAVIRIMLNVLGSYICVADVDDIIWRDKST